MQGPVHGISTSCLPQWKVCGVFFHKETQMHKSIYLILATSAIQQKQFKIPCNHTL